MSLSSITKGSAGVPTVGVSDRADYCVEEIESRMIDWSDDITNNDGVMASFEDIATDKNKSGPTKTVSSGDISATIPDLTSPTPFKLHKEGWETQFDNFVSKRADVNTASYSILDEMTRIRDVLKTYRNYFWDEETAVNTELTRLEGIRDQHQARRDYWYGQRDYYQGLIDSLNPLDSDYGTNLTSYTSLRDTASTNAAHHEADRVRFEGYRSTVLTECNAIFGDFASGARSGQSTTCENAVNGEFESILDTIHHGLVRACNRIGTKDVQAKYWVDTVDRSDATTYVGAKYADTPVDLLSYMTKFVKMVQKKDSVSKLEANTFNISEFETVSNELIAFDLTTTTTSFTDNNGTTQYAHYPSLNAAPDAKEALLTQYYSNGVSPKYYKDKQESLSHMAAQVSTAKAGVEETEDDLQALALSSQTGDWDTDLDNLETSRTQYSSQTYVSSP